MKYLVDKKAFVLRETARPVVKGEFGTKKLKSIIAKMKKALHAEEDGVAIAAPQVGESLRVFIVKGNEAVPDKVFINPEIIKASKKKQAVEEGCLSLRYLYGSVSRHEKVTLKALNENGQKMTTGASGLMAQIFQHEVDHLNGVLFTDKAKNVRDIPPDSAKASSGKPKENGKN